VIPLGGREAQTLTLVTRTEDGIERAALDPVVFVPLLSGIS
jgi:protein-L-isoaspartate O-methyltransferase